MVPHANSYRTVAVASSFMNRLYLSGNASFRAISHSIASWPPVLYTASRAAITAGEPIRTPVSNLCR